MFPRSMAFPGLTCLLLASCVSATGQVDSADRAERSERTFDASPFVPAGFGVLRVSRGDLNADGREDALIVATRFPEDPGASSAPRALSIVLSQPDGSFALSAVNTVLAACVTCGGRFGDGLVVASIEDGEVVVVNEGGSARYGWSNEYTFKLDTDGKRWMLRTYRSVVSSQPDQKFHRIEQSPVDFGVRLFESLTPQDLSIPRFD